jgi:hypothetical protein
MDIEKFAKRGQDAQTAVNKILSEAEVAMIRRQNATDQERIGRAIARADHQADELPAADAPVPELVEAIDKAVAVLRKYPDSKDLQYCVGYLEGFKELLKPWPPKPASDRVCPECGATDCNHAAAYR